MKLTQEEIQKFITINDKIRKEEIWAREVYQKLIVELDEMVSKKIIEDYEIEERYELISYDKEYCKSKNIEFGYPFFVEECIGVLHPNDDDFFNTNRNEFNWVDSGELKHLHFGYTMHCLMFHNNDLEFEDILKIDSFWLELNVIYQFCTDKNWEQKHMINLYLDDLRSTPENFNRVYSFEEFTTFITENGLPDFISFDHDLGEGKTGFDCAKWLVEFCLDNEFPLPEFSVHSQNPVGKENIEKLLENFKKTHG